MKLWGEDGIFSKGDEGEILKLGPHQVEIVFRREETGGSLGALIFTHSVITDDTPHAHDHWTKIAHVLTGKYSFRVGDAKFEAGPGDSILIPRGSHHAFTTQTGGKILFVGSPAGNEDFFLEISRLGERATTAQVREIWNRFGTRGLPKPR
ncbi:MAG TPA: cupin domain-containing protein [Streptomyces sp.]